MPLLHTPRERELYRNLAFLGAESSFQGMKLRPLSLASELVMEMMGLRLLDEEAELTLEEESRQIAVWIWLHREEAEIVSATLADGSWRGVLESVKEPMPAVVEAFRKYRVQVMMQLEAAKIDIKPRKKAKGDDTPRDVIGAPQRSYMAGMVAQWTNKPEEYVRWEMYLPLTWMYFHAAMRWNGAWTVAARRGAGVVKPEEVADLVPDFLREGAAEE